MATTSNEPPLHLYRGVKLPADALTEDIFNADLTPGSGPIIDEHGRATVADGNEYGVYMTDNPNMVDSVYANPRHGDALPGSPSFNWRHSSQSRVEIPRVGVTHQIDTNGLAVRKPFITGGLQGVYNNGFEGDEWIADRVPAGNHRVTKLRVGQDMLHPAQDFDIRDQQTTEVLDAVRAEIARRVARLQLAAQVIEEIPGNRRHFPGTVERVLSQHETLGNGGQ